MNSSALRTPIRRSLLRAVAALLLLAACPAPALAHAHLQRATPAAGARLTIAPRELVLTFSEAPTLGMSALRLLGPDSAAVALGTLGHSGGARTLSAASIARAESNTTVAALSGGTIDVPNGARSLRLLGVLPMNTGMPARLNAPMATRRLLSYC